MNAERDVAPWVERFARVGYVAKAILYATVGLLAMGAVFGRGESTDSRGAMMKILEAPFGRTLLAIVAIGLVGYAVWRCVSAVIDSERRGNDVKGLALRASFFARGLIHFGLAWSAIRFVWGAGGERSDNGKRAAGAALVAPGGTWLLWAVALGLAGFGLYQIYRAAVAKLSEQLRLGEARREAGSWIIGVSRFGIAARGLVFVAIAWLFGRAAASHDPEKAGGIEAALDTLAAFGRWPFAAIGAGLIAYGFYELVNARYRRVVAS
jgi:hypothetical protein